MKKQKEYAYEYPFSKEYLIAKLNNRRGINHNWNDGDYLIDIKNDDVFFLGVQRGGHSGGYWYVAAIEENIAGKLTVRGRIVYNPDDDGNEQKASRKDRIEFALIYIILLPVIVVIKMIQLLKILVLKIKKKPLPRPIEEEKLDKFMIDYLCCKKI